MVAKKKDREGGNCLSDVCPDTRERLRAVSDHERIVRFSGRPPGKTW